MTGYRPGGHIPRNPVTHVYAGEEFRPLRATEAINERAEQLAAVLRDLIDPDDCWFDHHGYCQAHCWLDEGECPHARAKRLLAVDAGQRPAGKGTGR